MRKWMTSHNLLILALALSVFLRLGSAFYLGDTIDGEQQMRMFDQYSYQGLAESILGGRGYSFPTEWYPFTYPNEPTAHWSFAYPLFLAAVYAVTGVHPLAARVVQVLIVGLLNPWLVYRLARRLFRGATEGGSVRTEVLTTKETLRGWIPVLAAAAYAVYPYLIFYDAGLMTEPFFISGVLGSLVLGLRLAERASADFADEADGKEVFTWLGLGVVLGVTALLRQTILLWAPFLYGWILAVRRGERLKSPLRRSLLGAGLSIIVAAVLILPWTVRNAVVYSEFLPLNSNAGYALYSANHPDHGTQFDQDYGAPLPVDLLAAHLNEAQWNTELTKRGIGFILADPGRFLLLTLDRVGIFFNFWFSSESSLSSNIMRVLSFGLYLPFFVWGLWQSRRFRPQVTLIWLFAAMFSALHILTWASIRYRLPIDAALMPFAALAVVDILGKSRRKGARGS